MAKKNSTPATPENWEVHVIVPKGSMTKAKAQKLQDTFSKLMPNLVETVASVHGVDASGSTAHIKRNP
jgi:hypothetical protein